MQLINQPRPEVPDYTDYFNTSACYYYTYNQPLTHKFCDVNFYNAPHEVIKIILESNSYLYKPHGT